MEWPKRPTCHDGEERVLDLGTDRWIVLADEHFQRCSYCGSMHPQDLVLAINDGAPLHETTMKYGFPHKFYVDVPNPEPERIVRTGSTSYPLKGPGRKREVIFYGPQGPTIMAKFYTWHLLDKGYDEEALNLLMLRLSGATRFLFSQLDERQFRWAFKVVGAGESETMPRLDEWGKRKEGV